jgi:hypothetical protein
MGTSAFGLHPIDRDENEQYLVVFGQGSIKVFELDGTEATVNIAAAAATYLALGNPTSNEMRMRSIADFTIILNTKVTASVSKLITTFTTTDTFDTYTKMTSRLPGISQYFRTTEDDGVQQKGFWQYAITDTGDNGFATWTGKAVQSPFKRPGGRWDSGASIVNPMGFRVRFERQNLASQVLVYDATGGAEEHLLTLSGAFSSYTFDAGDEIYINATGGTSLPQGWYPIGGKIDNNSIKLSDNGSAGVNYRDANDEIQTWDDVAGGDKSDSDSEYISVSGGVTENFNTTAAVDMDDIAERLQTNLRSNTGLEDAIIQWDEDNTQFFIVSPFRGSATNVVDITDPDSGFDLSSANNPFDWSQGTATSGSGSPSTDTLTIDERWDQVAAPGEGDTKFDASTMPVRLTRTTVNPLVFAVDQIEWKSRLSGTTETNPAPSIVVDSDGGPADITLSDIFFHRNRLGISGDENVVFSQDGDFFNFFLEDADNIVDSDPIDRALSSDQVTIIDFVVPFRKSLIIFTKSGRQFEMNAPEAMTPNTVSITPTTHYKSTYDVRPVAMHDSVFFTGPDGDRSKLFDYRFFDESVSNRADDVSAHVPELLPTTIKTVIGHPNTETIFILPEDSYVIYVYQQLIERGRREQAAWGKWTFSSNYDIDDISIIQDTMYLLVHDTDQHKRVLEKIELSDVLANLDDSGGQSLPTVAC